MSLTFNRVPDGEDVWGRTRVTLFDVTLDTSYPLTNGYVINPQDVGLKAFKSASVEGMNHTAGEILPVLDLGIGTTNQGTILPTIALRIYCPTGGATAPTSLAAPAGATTIGASTATPASGATAVTSTSAQPAIPVTFGTIATALTAGIGKEIGNGTNLSTVVLRIRFLGF